MSKRKSVLYPFIVALTAVSAALISPTVRAEGHGPGNSGNGVLVDGKIYLLDLVEAGVQNAPYFKSIDAMKGCVDTACTSRALKPEDAAFLEHAGYMLAGDFDRPTSERLTQKLLSMAPLVREEVLLAIALYQWRIADLPLVEIHGIQSPLDLSATKVYQLAERRDDAILLNRALWNRLDIDNRVALIIHEVIYAMLRLRPAGDGTFVQDSWDARLIVGGLFRESTAKRDLRTYVRNEVPVLSLFEEKPTDWRFSFVDSIWQFGTGSPEAGSHSGRVLFNTGADLILDRPGNARSRSWLSSTSEALPDPNFERWASFACDELAANGFRGTIRNSYVNAVLRFVDYRVAEGYTKAVVVDYSIKHAGQGIGTDSNGKPVVRPFERSVAYGSLRECMERFGRDATEAVRGY